MLLVGLMSQRSAVGEVGVAEWGSYDSLNFCMGILDSEDHLTLLSLSTMNNERW